MQFMSSIWPSIFCIAAAFQIPMNHQNALPSDQLKTGHQIVMIRDTSTARIYLNESEALLDSTETEAALAKASACVQENGHISQSIDIDAAALLEKIGLAFFRKGDFPQVIEAFNYAGDVYRHTSLRKSLTVARLKNNLGIALRNEWRLKEALNSFQESLHMHIELQGENNIDVARSYNNIGVVLSDLDKLREALDYYLKSLELKKALSKPSYIDISNTYLNIGALYHQMKNTIDALENYNLALEFLEKETDKDVRETAAKIYHDIAGTYTYRRDYFQSIRYHEKSIALRLDYYKENEREKIGLAYENLAAVYLEMKNYQKAEEFNLKGLEIILSAKGENSLEAGLSYYYIGGLYGSTGRFDDAESCLQKALATMIPYITETHSYIAECYNSLASIYEQQFKFEQALEYYDKAEAIFREISEGSLSADILRVLVNKGLVNKNARKKEEAIQSFDYVIYSQEKDKIKNPETQFSYFEALLYKGELLSETAEIPSDEQNALSLFEKAFAIGEEFRDALEDHYSKAEFLSLINRTANGLIHLLVSGMKADEASIRRAFIIAEKSKAFLLNESFRESQALASSNFPPALKRREIELRQDINYYEKQHYLESHLPEQNDSLINDYNDRLIDLKRNYSELKKSLENTDSLYYQYRYDRWVPDVYYIQNGGLVAKDQALLEYFAGDSTVYLFLVRKDTFISKEIALGYSLESCIKDFRQGLTGYYNNELTYAETINQYIESSHKLYRALIAPVEKWLPEKIVLVPDGPLGNLPFEALLDTRPADVNNLRTYPYLLLKYRFTYTYSANLLKEMQRKTANSLASNKLVCFAPFAVAKGKNNPRGQLAPLPFSKTEVEHALKAMKNGQVYYGSDASLKQFLGKASEYRVIHLATHAYANNDWGEYAFIQFAPEAEEDGKLYAQDLKNLSFPAEMLIISACEGGIGQLRRGEGVISLARGFAYAGAKSIITSLWSVSDRSTSDLMGYFYNELSGTGAIAKDQALRKAKIQFLEQAPNISSCHPFFWSGFICIGDMRPIDL